MTFEQILHRLHVERACLDCMIKAIEEAANSRMAIFLLQKQLEEYKRADVDKLERCFNRDVPSVETEKRTVKTVKWVFDTSGVINE
jgi:hypothetical protein